MAAYVKSTDVDLASNSKFIQVNDGANIGNIREGWPVFINQNLVGFAKVINTSANPPTIELYELYSGTAITAGNMSTFPSQGAITAIGDRITSLANTYESLSDSVAVNPVANSLVKRTGTGARVKTGNATENDDAVALGQLPDGVADLYAKNNILGTVSQTGGVPTGAVIERGSNSNGEYVKFADGTYFAFLVGNYTYDTFSYMIFGKSNPISALSAFVLTAQFSPSGADYIDIGSADAIAENGGVIFSGGNILLRASEIPSYVSSSEIRNVSVVLTGRWY